MSRAERIGGELHALLAEAIRREIKDPRVGMISITRVRVSGDLSIAEVYFLPLGGVGDATEATKGLRAAAGFLRRLVGKRMRLRIVPELRFFADDQHDMAVDLIRQLSEGDEGDSENGGEE